MNKDNAINMGKIIIKAVEWYIPHYTPTIRQQAILSKQNISKTPTELQYVERSVLMKEVNNQSSWTSQLGTHKGVNVPIWIIMGFQQRDRRDSENLNNDTF